MQPSLALMATDDFVDVLITRRFIYGEPKAQAAETAEALTGQHAVADLWRKAQRLADLFAEYHAAVSSATKKTIRRMINTAVEEEYAHERCEKDMTWLHARVLDVVPLRRPKTFDANGELSIWWEVATKQIRKSGCDACPWHKREQAAHQ